LQNIVFRFSGLEALQASLEACVEEQELPLPSDREAREGEWLLAEFVAADASTIVPACVQDRGAGLCVCFKERDWKRLLGFAKREAGCRDSIPPEDCARADSLGGTVLLVDTDASVQSIVRAMLASCGLKTDTVHSAEEALDRLQRRPYDLVVVEPALVGMSGLELCRQLRADKSLGEVPILVLASHSTDQDVREALCSGADDFVGKPFRAHELRTRAVLLIQRGKFAREARRLPA
jgi:CheY-like chemotaxis protein